MRRTRAASPWRRTWSNRARPPGPVLQVIVPNCIHFSSVGDRIRRICMLLGLPDPHPDPLVTSTNRLRIRLWPRILPSSSKNSKKNLDFHCFVTSYDLLFLKNDVSVPVFRIRIRMFLGLPDPLVRAADPRIRICIWIRTKMSRIPSPALFLARRAVYWDLHPSLKISNGPYYNVN